MKKKDIRIKLFDLKNKNHISNYICQLYYQLKDFDNEKLSVYYTAFYAVAGYFL